MVVIYNVTILWNHWYYWFKLQLTQAIDFKV